MFQGFVRSRGRRIRTLNKGFGDPRVTITPFPCVSHTRVIIPERAGNVNRKKRDFRNFCAKPAAILRLLDGSQRCDGTAEKRNARRGMGRSPPGRAYTRVKYSKREDAINRFPPGSRESFPAFPGKCRRYPSGRWRPVRTGCRRDRISRWRRSRWSR